MKSVICFWSCSLAIFFGDFFGGLFSDGGDIWLDVLEFFPPFFGFVIIARDMFIFLVELVFNFTVSFFFCCLLIKAFMFFCPGGYWILVGVICCALLLLLYDLYLLMLYVARSCSCLVLETFCCFTLLLLMVALYY